MHNRKIDIIRKKPDCLFKIVKNFVKNVENLLTLM